MPVLSLNQQHSSWSKMPPLLSELWNRFIDVQSQWVVCICVCVSKQLSMDLCMRLFHRSVCAGGETGGNVQHLCYQRMAGPVCMSIGLCVQVERLVEMSSTCAIKEWRRLPMIVSQVHVNLLQVPSSAVHWLRYVCLLSFVVVVVVVMTSPSGAAYMGGQMSRRDKEFHQTLVVLEHMCDVSRITEVTLAFCCPFWAEQQ